MMFMEITDFFNSKRAGNDNIAGKGFSWFTNISATAADKILVQFSVGILEYYKWVKLISSQEKQYKTIWVGC